MAGTVIFMCWQICTDYLTIAWSQLYLFNLMWRDKVHYECLGEGKTQYGNGDILPWQRWGIEVEFSAEGLIHSENCYCTCSLTYKKYSYKLYLFQHHIFIIMVLFCKTQQCEEQVQISMKCRLLLPSSRWSKYPSLLLCIGNNLSISSRGQGSLHIMNTLDSFFTAMAAHYND